MIATITLHGMKATWDGAEWVGDEPLLTMCRLEQEGLPFGYYPDPVGNVAKRVAAEVSATMELSGDPAPDVMPDPKEGRIVY